MSESVVKFDASVNAKITHCESNFTAQSLAVMDFKIKETRSKKASPDLPTIIPNPYQVSIIELSVFLHLDSVTEMTKRNKINYARSLHQTVV